MRGVPAPRSHPITRESSDERHRRNVASGWAACRERHARRAQQDAGSPRARRRRTLGSRIRGTGVPTLPRHPGIVHGNPAACPPIRGRRRLRWPARQPGGASEGSQIMFGYFRRLSRSGPCPGRLRSVRRPVPRTIDGRLCAGALRPEKTAAPAGPGRHRHPAALLLPKPGPFSLCLRDQGHSGSSPGGRSATRRLPGRLSPRRSPGFTGNNVFSRRLQPAPFPPGDPHSP